MTLSQTADIKNRIEKAIQNIPNFPKKGIIFKDLTPLLQDPMLCAEVAALAAAPFKDKNIDAVVGLESRGFWFGPLIAQQLNAAFIPIRKAGKLPGETYGIEYDLEYGTAAIELQKNALTQHQNIIIHDDVLATGGTAAAACKLLEMAGKHALGFTFILELDFLEGRTLLQDTNLPIFSIINT